MTHQEASRRIVELGGRNDGYVSEATDWLVVGQAGAPLGEDGRLTRQLLRAHTLKKSGRAIEILSEVEFIERTALAGREDELHRLYTQVQLARILDLEPRTLRRWVRAGLIEPVRVVRRLAFFDFAQVATAKTLAALHESGVRTGRIRRSLEQLAHWLPSDEIGLSQLKWIEREGDFFVRTDDGRLAETTGQLQLEFDEPAERAEPSALADHAAPAAAASAAGAEHWFDLGMQAEERGQLDDAAGCYREAIRCGAPQPEVFFNLGNVLYVQADTEAAADCFRRATELDVEYVEAWNNLGNVLAELERPSQALAAYRQAIAIEPEYADAHFNLAESLATAGQFEEAQKHWKTYLRFDPASDWSQKVRRRLGEGQESEPARSS